MLQCLWDAHVESPLDKEAFVRPAPVSGFPRGTARKQQHTEEKRPCIQRKDMRWKSLSHCWTAALIRGGQVRVSETSPVVTKDAS